MSTAAPIKFPQSSLIDAQGRLSREWVQWFLNPQFISLTLQGVIGVDSGGTGLGALPQDGQLLIGNGVAYTLADLTPINGLNIINGAGSIEIGIANTSVTPNIYGSASEVAVFSVNSRGQILSAGNLPIGIDAAQVTSGILPATTFPALTGDITTPGGSTNTTLATVNGAPGAYGLASSVGAFTVNGKGLVTVAGNVPIAITNAQVSGLGTLSTQNATSVAITGGAINGTPIGATTAATVRGTTVTATGALGCNGKTAQASAAVNAAIAGTAGATYTATEQGLINSLLALANQLRAALVANGIAV